MQTSGPTSDARPSVSPVSTDCNLHDMASKNGQKASSSDAPSRAFVERTYHLINTCPPPLAAWNATGDAFLVFDPSGLARNVLPLHFKHRNFSCFARQLKAHGFQKRKLALPPSGRKSGGKEVLEFRHRCFVRGRPDLLRRLHQPSPSLKVRYPTKTPAKEEEEEGEDLGAAMVDLRAQISMLRGEVQLTQQLFQHLLASIVVPPQHQQAAAPTSQTAWHPPPKQPSQPSQPLTPPSTMPLDTFPSYFGDNALLGLDQLEVDLDMMPTDDSIIDAFSS